MKKTYKKERLAITLTEYDKKTIKRHRPRRSIYKIYHLLDISQAKLFKIKITYFKNKDLINESIIENIKYIRKFLATFTSKSLIKSYENYLPNNYIKIGKDGSILE